jgi:CHAT domain-containing protein
MPFESQGSLTPETFVSMWLAQTAPATYFLSAHSAELGDPQFADGVALELKARAAHFLRADSAQMREMERRLYTLAEFSANPFYRALALRVEGNRLAMVEGNCQAALAIYDEAAGIYRDHGRRADQAEALIGKLVALDRLGRYEEVLELGQWMADVLEAEGRWLEAAKTNLNLFATCDRLSRANEALIHLDRARQFYERAGTAGQISLPFVEHDRAILLRNQGRFSDSLAASRRSETLLVQSGRPVEAARARQAAAITRFVLGQYNEALQQLDEVLEVFWRDGRQRDAMLTELYLTQCLLELRRFGDVLTRSQRLRHQFAALETRFEVAQALLNEATAYTGLRQFPEALVSLQEAHRIFADAGNQIWVLLSDMQRAAVYVAQGQPQSAYDLALACAAACEALQQPVNATRARLIAAQAAADQGLPALALPLVQTALKNAIEHDLPSLIYLARAVLGQLAKARGDILGAQVEYEAAIQAVERLQGHLLTEFRADFVADKNRLYEEMVRLCLQVGAVGQGLNYAERAKSRALLDLLAYRLDLSLYPRQPKDAALVAEILQLRNRLTQLYRHAKDQPTTEILAATTGEDHSTQREALHLEQQIGELWHKLLLRNREYERDVTLWQVQSDGLRYDLPPDTVMIEFFLAQGQWLAFVITADMLQVCPLAVTSGQLQRWLQLWQLNLKMTSGASVQQIAGLASNARGILGQLYQALIAPLYPDLAAYPRWLIVPHGALHYVPFHALYTGDRYLVEDHAISYLPSASVLPYCQAPRAEAAGWLVLGHSNGGRLPFALTEAQAVAALGAGHAYLEQAATLATLREQAGRCQVLHLALHGDFRPDNPLFSGLTLADSELTTLDVFNLSLRASLVTLSACQTGRSVVGGGDELLGLMRAFLYAGAASLVLSLWTVADEAASQLMRDFYTALLGGMPKSEALRQAQIAWLRRSPLAHPYSWAPFFLVGNPGIL